jgi:hypothetical protein
MTKSVYMTTRPFPSSLIARVGDLIPSYCRSVMIAHDDPAEGRATITAHKSEIKDARKAIRIARLEG